MSKTTRWEHPYPEVGDAADVPKWMKDLATNLDDVAKDDQGTKASRPTSTAESPGKKGRYYFATDEGVLYRDNGTGWDIVSFAPTSGMVGGGGTETTLSSAEWLDQGAKFEITPTVKSRLMLWLDIKFIFPGSSASQRSGRAAINVDGTRDESNMARSIAVESGENNLHEAVIFDTRTLTGGEKHTIKVQVRKEGTPEVKASVKGLYILAGYSPSGGG